MDLTTRAQQATRISWSINWLAILDSSRVRWTKYDRKFTEAWRANRESKVAKTLKKSRVGRNKRTWETIKRSW